MNTNAWGKTVRTMPLVAALDSNVFITKSKIKGGLIHGSQNEQPRTEFAVYEGFL